MCGVWGGGCVECGCEECGEVGVWSVWVGGVGGGGCVECGKLSL